jgi:hypothetical protein
MYNCYINCVINNTYLNLLSFRLTEIIATSLLELERKNQYVSEQVSIILKIIDSSSTLSHHYQRTSISTQFYATATTSFSNIDANRERESTDDVMLGSNNNNFNNNVIKNYYNNSNNDFSNNLQSMSKSNSNLSLPKNDLYSSINLGFYLLLFFFISLVFAS